jgi:hypothetical protein
MNRLLVVKFYWSRVGCLAKTLSGMVWEPGFIRIQFLVWIRRYPPGFGTDLLDRLGIRDTSLLPWSKAFVSRRLLILKPGSSGGVLFI